VKTESLREVKNNLSRVIENLPLTGAVLITKHGKSRAVLLPVNEHTDLESLLLTQNQRFWDLLDRAAKRRPRVPFADLPD
jgi:prevent-host-death family protein